MEFFEILFKKVKGKCHFDYEIHTNERQLIEL